MGASLVVLGGVIFVLLLFASIDSLPSVFDFNPIRTAKRVWETSDSGPVIKEILVGLPVPVSGLGILAYLQCRSDMRMGISWASFTTATLLALFLATKFVSPSAAVPNSDGGDLLRVPQGFEVQHIFQKVFSAPHRSLLAPTTGCLSVPVKG